MEVPFLFEVMCLGKGFREKNDELDLGLDSVVGWAGAGGGYIKTKQPEVKRQTKQLPDQHTAEGWK